MPVEFEEMIHELAVAAAEKADLTVQPSAIEEMKNALGPALEVRLKSRHRTRFHVCSDNHCLTPNRSFAMPSGPARLPKDERNPTIRILTRL